MSRITVLYFLFCSGKVPCISLFRIIYYNLLSSLSRSSASRFKRDSIVSTPSSPFFTFMLSARRRPASRAALPKTRGTEKNTKSPIAGICVVNSKSCITIRIVSAERSSAIIGSRSSNILSISSRIACPPLYLQTRPFL